ncbi:MAG: DNA-binding protein [Bacilli bacterium]|nr:DNA-binding protein [Bacilli bacterium]
MEERDDLIKLYDIYNGLLTDNERKCFEYYYFEDYSLNEIAEVIGTSRAYISKTLKIVSDKLIKYESILFNKKKSMILYDLLKDIKDKKIAKKIEEIIEM